MAMTMIEHAWSRWTKGNFKKRHILIWWHELYLTKGKIQIYNKKDDGNLEINRLLKWQSIMVIKVDPLTGN